MGSKLNTKDKIKFDHLHNVVYHATCPNHKCTSHYNGQTKCRIAKRAEQHKGKDKKSHISIHANKTKHKKVKICDFKVIGKDTDLTLHDG